MAVFKYNRISTSKQKLDRQIDKVVMNFSDICSGTIPFLEREEASKLFNVVQHGDTIEVESVCRLGRDKIEMLNTLGLFRELGVNIRIRNLGIESFPTEGNYSSVFDIITSLLSALSEYERDQINEKTRQGIEIAKLNGMYRGRKRGSVYSRDQYLERNRKSVQVIKKHPNLSLRELASLTGVSHVKVKKIKEML